MLRILKLDKESGRPTADPEAIDRCVAARGGCVGGGSGWGREVAMLTTGPQAIARWAAVQVREPSDAAGGWHARRLPPRVAVPAPLPPSLPPLPPSIPCVGWLSPLSSPHRSSPPLPPSVPRFTRKLKKVTAEQGARFVSYDAASGTWRFEVEHFSRYGLADSEDEDEEPAGGWLQACHSCTPQLHAAAACHSCYFALLWARAPAHTQQVLGRAHARCTCPVTAAWLPACGTHTCTTASVLLTIQAAPAPAQQTARSGSSGGSSRAARRAATTSCSGLVWAGGGAAARRRGAARGRQAATTRRLWKRVSMLPRLLGGTGAAVCETLHPTCRACPAL